MIAYIILTILTLVDILLIIHMGINSHISKKYKDEKLLGWEDNVNKVEQQINKLGKYFTYVTIAIMITIIISTSILCL